MGGLNDQRDDRLIGRDEMNLAEFPITLLTDQTSRGAKTLTFEGRHGKLTITGSDDYGLPGAPDADVIVGLIQLTKLRNDFTDPKVPFTRYELLKLLGWPDQGRHYRRLDDSLRRWVGVTLRYDQSWWDNEVKCRVDANFHILDSVIIFDQEVRRTLRARQQPLPFSSFTWGKTFFHSCQADNLKRLDLEVYFSLRSAISKQMYRFLDKRFYRGEDWTLDLRELAFEHVGLSRNYSAAKVKEKLRTALEELERAGFLWPMTAAERYVKTGRGQWQIRLVRGSKPIEAESEPEPQAGPGSLEAELIARGVTAATARELVRDFPRERIRAQIEAVDWARKHAAGKIADPGAFLAEAIRKDYAPPAGLRAAAERAEREAIDREKRAEARRAKEREKSEHEAIARFWEGLTPERRAEVEAEALAKADPETRARCEAGPSPLWRLYLRTIRDDHIRALLGLSPAS